MAPELELIDKPIHTDDLYGSRKGFLKYEDGTHDLVVAIRCDRRWSWYKHNSFLIHYGEHQYKGNTYQVYQRYLCNLDEFLKGCKDKSYPYRPWEGESFHPSETLIGIFRDIFKGLGFLQASRLEHGDVSVQNIFIVIQKDGSSRNIMGKLMGALRDQRSDFIGIRNVISTVFGGLNESEESKDLVHRLRYEGDRNPMSKMAKEHHWDLLLRHPLFYDQGRVVRFIDRFGDFLKKSGYARTSLEFQDELNNLSVKYCFEVGHQNDVTCGWGWARKFNDDMRSECEDSRDKGDQQPEEFYSDVRSLIRFYRNIFTHYFGTIQKRETIFIPLHVTSIFAEMRKWHPAFVIDIYKAFEKCLADFINEKNVNDPQYVGNYFVSKATIGFSEFQKNF